MFFFPSPHQQHHDAYACLSSAISPLTYNHPHHTERPGDKAVSYYNMPTPSQAYQSTYAPPFQGGFYVPASNPGPQDSRNFPFSGGTQDHVWNSQSLQPSFPGVFHDTTPCGSQVPHTPESSFSGGFQVHAPAQGSQGPYTPSFNGGYQTSPPPHSLPPYSPPPYSRPPAMHSGEPTCEIDFYRFRSPLGRRYALMWNLPGTRTYELVPLTAHVQWPKLTGRDDWSQAVNEMMKFPKFEIVATPWRVKGRPVKFDSADHPPITLQTQQNRVSQEIRRIGTATVSVASLKVALQGYGSCLVFRPSLGGLGDAEIVAVLMKKLGLSSV